MRLYFPNSGHLQNFGGFARRWDPSEEDRLEFSMHKSYVSVHPIAIAMAAAAAQFVRDRGGTIEADLAASDSSIRYLDRMKLTDVLAVDPELAMVEHASEGRFIPVTQVTNQAALNSLIVDMVPLLHASPREAGPIKYVITELVRNVLEHAASPVGAMVCAQYYADTERLSVGVADFGIGIRKSISRFHPAPTDLDGINLALRPGVTGATARLGGNAQNAGAGLFFTKSIARVSRNFFVVYSGQAMFKLLKAPEHLEQLLVPDPNADRATRTNDLPHWPGTAIGIDITVGSHDGFAMLLGDIRKAYHLDVKAKSKQHFRRPRFK
jgi:anti-sigma regulatory factor (Ser/Thr protein kinase)